MLDLDTAAEAVLQLVHGVGDGGHGVFLGAGFAAGGQDLLRCGVEVFGGLGGVDPGAVEQSGGVRRGHGTPQLTAAALAGTHRHLRRPEVTS